MATVASFRRKLNHEYFFKAVKSSYDMGTAKDQDILNFIQMGSLYKEDFYKITGKPYPEDTTSTPSSVGSNTNDSKGNSSSASSSTGSAGSTASSNSSDSQSSTADSSSSGSSSKGSATAKKSNDSK